MGIVAPLNVAGTALLVLGELCHIISVSTVHWVDADKYYTHSGIFNYCDSRGCQSLKSVRDITTAFKWPDVQAMQGITTTAVCLGIGALAIAAVTLVYKLRSKPVKFWMLVLCDIASLLAILLTVAGVVFFKFKIFDKQTRAFFTDESELGYSYVLSCLTVPLFIVGAVLVHIGGKSG